MNNKNSIKLVTLCGECFEVAFQREMELPNKPTTLYHFHVTDLVKKRGKRLVSVPADWTLQVEIPDYDSRLENVLLNAIRRAFDSGVLSFDLPVDDQHYRELSLTASDFQNRSSKTEAEIRQYIIQKAYWLAYRSPMQLQPNGIIFPIPFDDAADLDYLGVEPFEVRRIIQRLANQGMLDKVLARIIHEGTESGSLGGVCALRMVVAA